jgi:hypothetical protein
MHYRPAMKLPASAGGNRVSVVGQLVQPTDTVQEVIRQFNEISLA